MTKKPEIVRLDLNNLVFLRNLFALAKDDQRQALTTLGKLFQMTWDQVYRDPGLKWEAVASQIGPHGGRLYSFRMGKALRAVAYRQDDWMRILSLHPDHDSAYG
ncbi:MAG: hypothetical protein ACRD00_06460 [Thermoanaerobaculia bacterium]